MATAGDYYGMRSVPHQKINPAVNPQDANYYEPDRESLIVVAVTLPSGGKPKMRLVRSWGDESANVGKTVGWTTDTGNGYRERYSSAKVLGVVAPGGKVVGEVPDKPLPLYVMK